ncbi:uncharacterized protein LOC133899158 [Phragmites australis]|uniref:uncharacterized protein LOC133899158 n=1 Tax=Phragmites australis TaxID=29695 RepID=UPI002D764D17|nr:uncharacterized protein LOC133899158 [Phragmites australis]
MTILDDIPPAISGHPAHPEHKLKLVTTDDRQFKCDGCMEPGRGAGTRYRCEHERCNFDLHTCCACAVPTLKHYLFGDATFVFLLQAPDTSTGRGRGQGRGRVCDACGERASGFVYHCFDDDLDLHPCCAHLPERFIQDGRVFELHRKSSRPCGMCGGKNRRRSEFWAYRSYFEGEAVDLHVACMKEMFRLGWDAEYQNRVGGGQIVQASAPSVDRMLHSLPRKTRKRSGFQGFCKIVGNVVSIIIAVIFGNPVAMMAAIAGPGGLLRG